MAKQIRVTVGPRGQVSADFAGFLGDACYEEAEALRRALAALGLRIETVGLVPKPASAQEQEAGVGEAEAQGVEPR